MSADRFNLPPEAKETVEQAKQSDFPQTLTLTKFLDDEIPEPQQLVQGLFHQGSKVVIGGGSKSYKTWLLSDMAISVAAGVPWVGFETIQGRVLYANLELQLFAYQKRLREIIKAKKLTSTTWMEDFHLVNLRGHCSNTRELLHQLQSRGSGFSLIIIDPLYKLLAGRVENSAEDMNDLFNQLEQLAEKTGAAIVLGNHFSKGNQAGKESIDRISGSGVFARDPDTIITVTRHAAEDAYTVESTLRNLAPVPPFVARWEHPLFKRAEGLNPKDLKKPPGKERKFKPEMIRAILDNSLRKLSKTELVKAAKEEYGMGQTVAYDLVAEAENVGLIKKTDEGYASTFGSGTDISDVARFL